VDIPSNPVSQPLPSLQVYLLGLIEFDDVQRLQRRLVYELGENPGAALILCEHPPTITVGRNGSRAHIRADDKELAAMDMPVRWVNRGGGCVLHMPGQLAGYLAMSLPAFGLDLWRYIDSLHQVILNVLPEFDLSGHKRDDVSGIFLGPSRVATVGVAVGRWIAYHGFTLNVGPFLDPFRVIDETAAHPGVPSFRVTSMEAWRQRPTPMSKVREAVIRHIETTFGLERNHIYTSHPMIRRKARIDVFASSYQ
jgi:lipoyl(octanoyl) transferase